MLIHTQLVTSEKHQKSLLGGFERLLALSPSSDSLLSSGTTSKILMALYQDDILDEEVVRQWGTHVSKKYVDKDKSKRVRKSAEAFVKVSVLIFTLCMADNDNSGLTKPTTNPTSSRCHLTHALACFPFHHSAHLMLYDDESISQLICMFLKDPMMR